jgi:anti-sigma factor RsiW
MFTGHVSRQLAAHLDGQLSQPKARRVERHLTNCARCRAEHEQIQSGIKALENLRPVEAPAKIWASIDAALQENQRRAPGVLRRRWTLAAVGAFAVLALAGAAVYWRTTHPQGVRWDVVWLAGHGSGRIGAGEWIETDARSQARVEVGAIGSVIGSVDVAPNTRVRVLTTRSDEHRLALARGEIRAKISAPPKLFFVDTAAGTAVDLGCEYDLSADDLGAGWLRVTRGWVSFQWKGAESLVPAGASCRTRPQAGPGIPYFDDASDRLKQAADAFVFDKGGSNALRIILAEARVRDTLTLWHLLSRVEAEDRGRVFDRINALTRVPASVSREQTLRLDPQTLDRLREELAWKW